MSRYNGGPDDTVRHCLDAEATPGDGGPFYCVYTGSIQGVWSRWVNVALISNLPGYRRFCKAYTWSEVRYVLCAGESFRDILQRQGWTRLYAVLIDLFGSEQDIFLGPELQERLLTVPDPPLSLSRVLGYMGNSPGPRFSHSPSNSDRARSPSRSPTPFGTQGLRTVPFRERAINLEVRHRMIIFDAARQSREPSTEVQVLDQVISSLNALRSDLLAPGGNREERSDGGLPENDRNNMY